MQKIKVAICGLGFTGRHIARSMLQKESVECVGASDLFIGVGSDLGDVLELNKKIGVVVTKRSEDILITSSPDVWIESTSSYIKEIYPRIMNALNAGVNVITLAEEFTDPWLYEPELADDINQTAIKNNVTVVGTGFNPGLWMDVWPFFLTGYVSEIKKITVHYMSDLSPYAYSPTVVKNYGFGMDPESVRRKIDSGEMKLSIGTKGLANNLATSLGEKIVDISEMSRPLISSIKLDFSPVLVINPGQVYGGSVDIAATTEKGIKISFYKQFCLKPSMEVSDFGENPHTAARIEIEGEPNISSTLSINSVRGFSTTAPRLVNWIPHIVKAKPGLMINMSDFPLIGAIK
jgi:2,4-diaminopentanoate dehydrogenase